MTEYYSNYSSALEEEHGDLASVVHVQSLTGLSGDLKGETFSHDAMPGGTELLVHLELDVLASLLVVDTSGTGSLFDTSGNEILSLVVHVVVHVGVLDTLIHKLSTYSLINSFKLLIAII